MAADVTIGLAFLAGLASFLSPCVLALVRPMSAISAGAPFAPIRLTHNLTAG